MPPNLNYTRFPIQENTCPSLALRLPLKTSIANWMMCGNPVEDAKKNLSSTIIRQRIAVQKEIAGNHRNMQES
jgi:hypothetical protein